MTKKSRPKILVVDDDSDMRIFFSSLLKSGGFSPIVAKNGIEGLQKVKAHHPALIIIEVPMPENGGIRMFQDLKQNSKFSAIPVMMVSSIDKQTYSHYLNTKGIRMDHNGLIPDAFLEKPPEAADVLDFINKALGLDNNKEQVLK